MNLQEKAKDAAAKAKLAAENMKGQDGNISLNSIQALDNKTKLIGGSILAFVILLIISMFSGGRAYSLDTLSAPFPSDGDITERCESLLYLKYDYFHLVNDGVKPSEITAVLTLAAKRIDKATYQTLPPLEKKYYKELMGVLRNSTELTNDEAGTIKERRLDISRYEKALNKCIAKSV